jgi:hypothetical protein
MGMFAQVRGSDEQQGDGLSGKGAYANADQGRERCLHRHRQRESHLR